MKPLTCSAGFDPFGDRSAAFATHLAVCPHCADVVRVLGTATVVWKDESSRDGARGMFRERRLAMSRGRAPARTTAMGAALLVAVGVTSAWGFGRLPLPWHAPAGEHVVPPPEAPLVTPSSAPRSIAAPTSGEVTVAEPIAQVASAPPEAVAATVRASTPRAASTTTPAELWELALARLERGDRQGAAMLLQRVLAAPNVDPELRHRAIFRLSEVRLAMGDTVTPVDALRELVHDPDAALGFDSALLLERCVHSPTDRAAIWDAYLMTRPAEPLRTQALARRQATGGDPIPPPAP